MSAVAQLTADLVDILDHHVPAIGESGMTITTTYGQLYIEQGRLADHIADLIAQDARLAQMRLEVTDRMGELA